MRTARALWAAVVAIVLLTVVGQVLLPFAPRVDDMNRLLTGAHSLVIGRPPGDLLSVYPATAAVQYVPLGLLPRDAVEVGLRIACVALLAWIVVAFGRGDGGRLRPWSLVLLLSPPVIDAVRIDQFNTVLALCALVVANRLLASRRSLIAGLVAGVAMARPFASAPVIAGVLGGTGGRARLRMAAGAAAVVGLTVGVAFAWDHSLIHDIAATSGKRWLQGPIALIRSDFGVSGLIVALAVTGILCALVTRAGSNRPLDAFVATLAISCIGVHLGGPYVAVFTLPGLARLAATVSPWWSVATTLGYAALTAASVPAATAVLGQVPQVAFILAPLLLAFLPLWLLYRPLGAGRTVAAVGQGAIPAVEAG